MNATTWNEYMFQRNIMVMSVIGLTNWLFSSVNIPLIQSILQSKMVCFAEGLLLLRCGYNVWRSTRHIGNPYLTNVQIPVQRDNMSGIGPLTNSITHFIHSVISKLILFTTGQNIGNEPLIRVFSRFCCNIADIFRPSAKIKREEFKASVAQKTPIIIPVLSGDPLNLSSAPKDSATTTQSTFPTPYSQDKAETKHLILNNSIYEFLKETDGLSQVPWSPNPIKTIEYVPCLPLPAKPVVRQDRVLWQLNPTPHVIERFREAQYEDFQNNWNRFNDHYARRYYERLFTWLSTKIMVPLKDSIKKLDAHLAEINTDLSKCTPQLMAILMFHPSVASDPESLPLGLVQSMINLPGFETNEGRKHVIDRVIDLASSKRMAAFRYFDKGPMPTDSEILYHIFKQYLDYAMPQVVPPLIDFPINDDVVKFLLVFFYVTPELKHDIFHL
ncbi:hypothetical protein CLU79DRAFT_767573 [Phycomyces nitens]|nr:hypothetical protein CLU79DRAFT_767573 [Phycomyces nitens]